MANHLNLWARTLSFVPATALAMLSCARTNVAPAPDVGATVTGSETSPQLGCELENLVKITNRDVCPQGTSPAQVLASELEGPIHSIDPALGFVIAEAEALPGARSKNWQPGDLNRFPQFAPDATNTRFLMWTGGHCTGEVNLEDPLPHTRQGLPQDWLVIKFQLPAGAQGRYQLFLRTSHRLKDGDNDLWAGLIGQQAPIKRAGFGPAGKFSWSKGPSATLEAGTHAFFVAGRSSCMGVDQLAVARADVLIEVLEAQSAIAAPK